MNMKLKREKNYEFGNIDFSNNYYVIKKGKKVPLPSIDEIIKNARKYSKQNMLSYFIQYLFKKEDEDEDENKNIKNELFESLKDDIFELSQDFYGNYVIQEIINLKDKEKNDFIYNKFIDNDIVMLSCQKYGCRVLQKLMNYIDKEKIKLILEKIKNKLYELITNQNGYYVIQKIIEKLDGEIDDIYNEVFTNLDKLLNNENPYGSFIIQEILKKINDEKKKENIIKEIFQNNIENLCKNIYNNHILKFILENNDKYIDFIFQQIKDKIYELAKDNYALYVIETLLIKGNKEQKKQILNEIIEVDKDNNNDYDNDKYIEEIIEHEHLINEEIIKDIFVRIKNNVPNILIKDINFIFIKK